MKQFLIDVLMVGMLLLILWGAGYAIHDLLTNTMYAFNLGK